MSKKKSVSRFNEKEESAKQKSCANLENHFAVTIEEGFLLGNISKVYLDLWKKTVSALELKKNLWGEKFFILVDDINFIGEDVVFINKKSSVKSIHLLEKNKHSSLNKLKGTLVTTLNGKHLGELDDLCFNSMTFEINEILLKGGGKFRLNNSEITIGEDEILVPREYQNRIRSKTKHKKTKKSLSANDLLDNLSRSLHFNSKKKQASESEQRTEKRGS